MKAISSAVLALLQTGEYVSADLWTITLNGGSVIRWTSADKAVSFGGNTWAKGPLISRGTISEKTGVDVATLEVEITGLETDLINGVPVIPFIALHGLDGASVKLERGFAPDWASAMTGTVIRFAGKVTSVTSIQGATAKLVVSSWMILLNADMPRNVYQAACMHTLYDAGCTINPASVLRTGVTVSGAAGQTISFPTDGPPMTPNDYALGRIVFTSGANNGISRTVKSNSSSNTVTLVAPLPHPLAVGDSFTLFPGCDLTTGAGGCAKFNNLPNFKGTPFVPLPRTVIGTTSSTTTKSGK